MKTYLFHYTHNGKDYSLSIVADNKKQAVEQLKKAKYDGMLRFKAVKSIFSSCTMAFFPSNND